MEHAVIVDAVRNPVGKEKPGGGLAGVHPIDLLAGTLEALVARTGIDPALVEDVITGCAQQVGEQSGNIGRNASLAAGFPETVPGTTINRQCGSSQQAATFAAQGVTAGGYDIVIADRQLAAPVQGAPAPPPATPTGWSTRVSRLNSARSAGSSSAPTSTATPPSRTGGRRRPGRPPSSAPRWSGPRGPRAGHRRDGARLDHRQRAGRAEAVLPHRGDGGPLPGHRLEDHPGNSSPLTHGASAVLIMSESRANELGLRPRARFHAFSVVDDDPLFMLTGPIPHPQDPRAQRHEPGRDRRLRGQRGIRVGAAGLGRRVRRRPGKAEPRAAGRSRWATRSAAPA